jgi:DNA-binding transcriptional LysR family regulator
VVAHPLIGYPRHLMAGFVDLVHAALAPARAQLRYAHKVVHEETALGFVAAGEGLTVLPETVREQLPASIRAVPIDTELRSRLVAVTAPSGGESSAATAFVECLVESARG